MTLIAARFKNGLPLLFGDILVTSQRKTSEHPLELPLHGKTYESMTGDYAPYPVLLRQKILLINDHLAVGVTGSEQHINDFLRELTYGFSKDRSKEDLEHFLSKFKSLPSSSLGYIIIMTIPKLGVFAKATDHRRSQDGAHSWVAGSGAESYKYEDEILNKDFQNTVAIGSTAVLAETIQLLISLLCREFISLTSISKSWGAGFEIVVANGGKLEKTDCVCVLLKFWDVLPRIFGRTIRCDRQAV